ncbi:CYIR protein [Plasmodium cynomolgi strain B]|uniref:CYIR protein n=1 Tax=Plasmodium cynomolgi (strain B) TaxID=1120755 RepID=K6V372_PLACD|nr:CYIR protein [Plasmodium cynomolgi strain B]GAB69800.1 CYIR protein [Plasmodium cynomolgi strain B]
MTNYCNGSHDKYLSYKCHEYLSKQLDEPTLSDRNKVYLEIALNSLGEAKYNEFFKHNIINELAARLGNDGVFWHSYTNTTCNYINFKLNESLRTHYSDVHKVDYSIFREFVKIFYNKRHNNYDVEYSCENYIRHLDDDIYKRMLTLYKIFYLYNEFKISNNYKHTTSDDELCNKLSFLIHLSNDSIE